MNRRQSSLRIAAAATTLALACLVADVPSASALPTAGALRPAARVFDADGGALDLRAINGRPTLILYEDKDSATMNATFKKELAALAKGETYRNAVALVPVADVQSYDYWPARGFVKDAIRSESTKINATIYCDWDGSFQRALNLRRGTSSIVLVRRDARIAFASEGPLDAEQRAQVLSLLRAEIDGPTAQR